MNEHTIRCLARINAVQLIDATYAMSYDICALAPRHANEAWLKMENMLEFVVNRPDSVDNFVALLNH